ncbi:DUF1194 domain-containing protein [Puniceibacterium confluentis]|uniref:DUF1194 domain-containing protein n=1 Tax=Puniceibacterium confluentis TaxID=1958944 RepID=UPI0034E05A70
MNGLVVGAPPPAGQSDAGAGDLGAYFRAYVISGPDAFVEMALGYRDFEAAMVRKLRRELIGPVYSSR